MWNSALRDWPDEDVPVACWERDELYVAKRLGGLWYECSTYGDTHLSRGAPLLREPEKWAHLPARPVKFVERFGPVQMAGPGVDEWDNQKDTA